MPGRKRFLPDGISMAKSLAGGLPMGASGCASRMPICSAPARTAPRLAASRSFAPLRSKSMEIIQRDKLADNARELGNRFVTELLQDCGKVPLKLSKMCAASALMIGLELQDTFRASADRQDRRRSICEPFARGGCAHRSRRQTNDPDFATAQPQGRSR